MQTPNNCTPMHPIAPPTFLLFQTLLCLVAAWLVLTIIQANKRKRKNDHLKTPPGSLGLPFVGETFQFAKSHPSISLGEFIQTRIKRYGKIYKTHVMGNPTIMSGDLEFNQFVLRNDGKLFEHNWPKVYEKMLGTTLRGFNTEEMHKCLKNVYHYFLSIPRLQSHFFRKFELYSLEALKSWEENTTFSAIEETKKVTFHMIMNSILSLNPGDRELEELMGLYELFTKGFRCVPLDLPGTSFRKALKARRAILKIIEGIRNERTKKRRDGERESLDFLDTLLDQSNLTVEELLNLIVGMLLAGYETSSTALAMSMSFLAGCPKAIQQLREEHMDIVKKKKERKEIGLKWEDLREMNFTKCVINETMRLGNVTKLLHRRARTDIQFQGYVIPSGWNVIPIFAATHLDGDVYKQSQCFDPWRWQDISMTKEMMQNYMPFSQGLHKCAGMDLAKMEMSIFLHHLVLNYEWEMVEPDQLIWQPGFPEFPKGLPIKVHKWCLP